MGHRRFLGSPHFFDDENDQGWNHIPPEHPYTSLARSETSENRSNVYPTENILNEEMPVSSHWNPSPGPNTYTASGHGVQRPHYHPGASAPSHDSFMSSMVPNFSAPHDNCVTFASSPNCNNQSWSNAGYVDQSVENVRGAQKRKSPCTSSIYEMGSSSQYHSDRPSSDTPYPSELQLGKSIMHDHDPHYMQWLMNPTYRNNNLSIRGDGSSRNVRSRSTLDLETSIDRNDLPGSLSLNSHSTDHLSVDHSGSSQFPGQTLNEHKDWNCPRLSTVPRDINGFSSETHNVLPTRSFVNNTSVDTTGYHHGIGNRNPTVSYGFSGTSTPSTSSSCFSHRSAPTNRSSHYSRLGHATSSSGDRSHIVTESYPSRHLRPPPHISWRSGDRSGRRRSSYERFQPPLDEAALHERFLSERFMIIDRQPQYHGSRDLLDHHRDMRLNIDDMSYEELLALGERIGSVNTGLSESAITSCLLVTTYYNLNETEDQRKCAICLEEYKEKEELGEVKGCGHDYHWKCIKKWLSMKNSCPICKSPALPDDDASQ